VFYNNQRLGTLFPSAPFARSVPIGVAVSHAGCFNDLVDPSLLRVGDCVGDCVLHKLDWTHRRVGSLSLLALLLNSCTYRYTMILPRKILSRIPRHPVDVTGRLY
jgi:hypothetical protein